MMGRRCDSVLWFVGLGFLMLVPKADGYPGMKTSAMASGDRAEEKGGEGGGMEAPPPGGTPPPATVAGLKALFNGAASDTALPKTGPGVLEGQVHDDVSESPVLGGLRVTLSLIHGNKIVSEKQAETDQAGKFVFRDLVTDPTVSYGVSVIYQGVRYAPDTVSFQAGKTQASIDVPVYPSGPAPGKARVKGSHVILAGAGDVVHVTEMIFIENPEQKALIGSPEGTMTLELQIPKMASNLSVDQGLQRDHVSVGDGSLYYDGPLYPGTNQVILSYQVKPATGWSFRRRMQMPVDMFDVFVKASALRVESQVLGPGEHLDMRGTPFVRYHGGPFEPATLLSFSLTKAPAAVAPAGSSGGISAVPIAVMVALFVSFFVALPLLRQSSGPVVEDGRTATALRRELEAERDRHLLAVADLDLDFQAGKLNEEDYQALRDRYKADAMAVMRRLDQLDAGRGAEKDRRKRSRKGSSSRKRTQPASSANAHQQERTTALQSDDVRFCTQCGKRLGPDDRFCARCGTPVVKEDG